MSKRSHHRNNGININELAEALTRQGWQPPRQNSGFPPMGNLLNNTAPPRGNDPLSGNLQALSGLLGAVNGGMPPAPMPNPQNPQNTRTTDKDLLRALFQQVLKELRDH